MTDLEELLEEAIEEQGDIKNVTIKNAGLDFSDCDMSGLIVSDTLSELRGAVVNPIQAVELAKLLGIVVKE